MGQTRVVAHRGYWKAEGSCQNSIKSLEMAAEVGAYASEVDTWLTKDGKVVVNHDSSFKGVKMMSSDTEDILKVVLDNGEKLPTLEQYLERADELGIRLIVEIKSKDEIEAPRKIAEIIKQYNMADKVDVIVWTTLTGNEMIRLLPNTPVHYLSGTISPKKLKRLGYSGFSYNKTVLRVKKNWIKQAKKIGLKSNVWTVNSEDEMKYFIEQGVDFITTDEPQVLNQILQ